MLPLVLLLASASSHCPLQAMQMWLNLVASARSSLQAQLQAPARLMPVKLLIQETEPTRPSLVQYLLPAGLVIIAMGTGSAGSAFLKAHSPSFRSRAQIGHGRPIFMFLRPAALPEHCAAGRAAALRPFQADSPGCVFVFYTGRIESHCAGLRDSIWYGKPFTTVPFCLSLLSSPCRIMHASSPTSGYPTF